MLQTVPTFILSGARRDIDRTVLPLEVPIANAHSIYVYLLIEVLVVIADIGCPATAIENSLETNRLGV